MEDPEGLVDWAVRVPDVMREDPIWRLPAYRFALYLGDLAQLEDAPLIRRDYRTRRHLDQFLDAVGSISANIAEGYGRTTGPERARFYEYAESSAREARDWFFKVRHALRPEVATSRVLLVSRIMTVSADRPNGRVGISPSCTRFVVLRRDAAVAMVHASLGVCDPGRTNRAGYRHSERAQRVEESRSSRKRDPRPGRWRFLDFGASRLRSE